MKIKLTKTQIDWIDWAVDAMRDHVEADGDDCDYSEIDLPTLAGDELIVESRAVAEDMIYRLRVQLGEMNSMMDLGPPDPEFMRAIARHRSCCLVADKLDLWLEETQ